MFWALIASAKQEKNKEEFRVLKIHKKVEYALMILRFLKNQDQDKRFSAKDISTHFQLPFDVSSRVLQILSFHSYLRSEQGPKGGYQLSDKPMDLNLYELVMMLEGPQALVKCLEHDSQCPITNTCNVITPMNILNQKFNEFLKQIAVRDLLLDASLNIEPRL